MSQKFIKSKNNNMRSTAYGKYFAKAVYDKGFIGKISNLKSQLLKMKISLACIIYGKLSILTSRLKNSLLGRLWPPEASRLN